ncbi:glycoside hydrolase family 65 protein [Caldibacillus debilis]|uniref:glycoside hydrolase family 65 protein n=1 Tax=Caldibacillus debilis TaxID=301148 RepID=UPI000E362021|nr:glycosyl hydrolase family 65 protein [Caldibacillus debilis]REJ30980.1 MAG: family 65 glycosyl hydrolase [Caldibacillus debilis]
MSWTISHQSLKNEDLLMQESLYSLANGYLGVRGNFEEGYPADFDTIRGTYINAFHDIVDVKYGEKLPAFPETQQKLVNIIDAQGLDIFLGEDMEKFSPFTGEILSYSRILHLDKGYTERAVRWRSPKGKVVDILFRRLVSFRRKELFAIQLTIRPVNFYGQVKIVGTVDGDVENYVSESDPRVGSGHNKLLQVIDSGIKEDVGFVLAETKRSKLQTACLTKYIADNGARAEQEAGPKRVTASLTFPLNQAVTVEKRNVYTDTLRHGEDLVEKGLAIHRELEGKTFSDFLAEQKAELDEFWRDADVRIDGDAKLQEGIRFNLFHLLQSAGRDPHSHIAAKGLSGEGYEGHYFWDTEIYMVPVFILTKPELAKKLLIYRHSKLGAAREHARNMGHKKGALYPWRTISGSECSSYFPSGSAQYHISADIAYSYIQYYLATGDEAFLAEYGGEVLFETARLWLETGHFRDGQFRIDAVTGPDEYTCIVNNNYYTNAMAKYNLRWAAKIYDRWQREKPELLRSLKEKLSLADEEKELWQRAAECMFLPYDEKLKINPQDDTFLQKAVWDFANTPGDHYPLLLHYHPLTLYRYQVCKQADTVLAHFLLDEEDLETMKNSYLYYEKITTHDSSLSSCIFSIMGAKIGDVEKAYRYFVETARLDLDNTHGNTKDGLHLANMGGTYMGIIFGFAGLRIKESGLHFAPKLPDAWKHYRFTIQYRKRKITVDVDESGAQFQLEGDPLTITVNGESCLLEGKKSFPLLAAKSK